MLFSLGEKQSWEHTNVSVVLHRARNIPDSCSVLSMRGAEDAQGAGKGSKLDKEIFYYCKTWCETKHEKRLGVAWGNRHCSGTGRSSVGNEQLLEHYLFNIYVLHISSIYYCHNFFLIFLFCPSEYFYFNPWVLLCCLLSCIFFILSPVTLRQFWELSKWMCGTRLNQNMQWCCTLCHWSCNSGALRPNCHGRLPW